MTRSAFGKCSVCRRPLTLHPTEEERATRDYRDMASEHDPDCARLYAARLAEADALIARMKDEGREFTLWP